MHDYLIRVAAITAAIAIAMGLSLFAACGTPVERRFGGQSPLNAAGESRLEIISENISVLYSGKQDGETGNYDNILAVERNRLPVDSFEARMKAMEAKTQKAAEKNAANDKKTRGGNVSVRGIIAGEGEGNRMMWSPANDVTVEHTIDRMRRIPYEYTSSGYTQPQDAEHKPPARPNIAAALSR